LVANDWNKSIICSSVQRLLSMWLIDKKTTLNKKLIKEKEKIKIKIKVGVNQIIKWIIKLNKIIKSVNWYKI